MLAPAAQHRYGICAGAKSSAGFSSPKTLRRTSAFPDGAFFVPLWRLCVGGFGLPVSFVSGLLTRVQSPPLFSSDVGDSKHKGVLTMATLRLFPTRTQSARAAAHRAMAKSALFADSSAAVRLKRYNSHMQKARALEAATSAQGVTA